MVVWLTPGRKTHIKKQTQGNVVMTVLTVYRIETVISVIVTTLNWTNPEPDKTALRC